MTRDKERKCLVHITYHHLNEGLCCRGLRQFSMDSSTGILSLLLIEWATKSDSEVIERGLLYSSIYSAGESARELREGFAILSVIMRNPLAMTLK